MFGRYGAKGMMASLGQMVSSPSKIKSHVLSNRKAYGIAGKGASKKDAAKAFQSAYQTRARQVGRRTAVAAPLVAAPFAMRPNANESRTSYRGPTQTGRGIGRFS